MEDSLKRVSRFRFVIKKLSAHESMMAYWLEIPEFIDALVELDEQGISIENETVLPHMKKICENRVHESRQDGGRPFCYGIAHRAIKQIEKAVKSSEVQNDLSKVL